MKVSSSWIISVPFLITLIAAAAASGQGKVTFDSPWATGGVSYETVYYDGSGISFRVGDPARPHDNMALLGAALVGHPSNGTPHLEFDNTLNFDQHVVFAWIDGAGIWPTLFTNGAPFGLTSVDLGDPVAPSLSPVSITFNGFKMDGSMVSQTFTVGGGSSSTFQTFHFSPDFAWGLTRVEIPSPAWAMDNIVWIPEPGAISLFAFGALILVIRKRWNG